MKSCKSSETRFAKVSRRSEPCSGGKRPFEVSKKNRNSRVGVRKGNVAQELHAFGAVLVLRYLLYRGVPARSHGTVIVRYGSANGDGDDPGTGPYER